MRAALERACLRVIARAIVIRGAAPRRRIRRALAELRIARWEVAFRDDLGMLAPDERASLLDVLREVTHILERDTDVAVEIGSVLRARRAAAAVGDDLN